MTFGHKLLKTLLVGAGLLASVGPLATAASADDQINVRFSWKLKGEYGPLYLAQQNGLFTAQNLTVRMGEGAGAPAALGALLQGQEDVVILPGIFAISAIQKGMPIKLIAIYHARTPVVIISHPDKPVLKPKDMEGKSIVTSVGETGTTYLGTFAAQNNVDINKIERVQVDAQIRVNYFLQNKVDMVSVYRTNDLPSVEEKTGIKFPILDMAAYGLAIPGLAAVSSDAVIAKKGDALRRFLAGFDRGIEATRKDPVAAAQALQKAWNNPPSLAVIEAQVTGTVDAIQAQGGHPAGWMTAQQIKSSLDLLKTDEDIGTPRPPEVFFTNDLLPTKSGT